MRILFVNAVGPTDISAVETGTVHQLYTTIGLQTDLANRTSEIASLLKRLAHIPRRAILPYAQSTGTLTVDWLMAHSTEGGPMLFGGPQLPLSTPDVTHEVQLKGPDVNVAGMSFAGILGALLEVWVGVRVD